MKKNIYIITTYIVLFTSLEITYGKRIEAEKKNHDAQLNNFRLYNNLKGINFNNSNSSNEKQYNNKNNVINNKKFIQPHSITYFGNQKDTVNDEITLYNDYTNKNDFDTFKSFNNDNEKVNRKETIVKSSFIQKFDVPPFTDHLYNLIDIIYGTSYINENLESFFVKFRTCYTLQFIDNAGYYHSQYLLDSISKQLDEVNDGITKSKAECRPHRTNLINEMFKIQNPLHEFYKDSTDDNYKSYESFKKEHVNCILTRFKNLETILDGIISSMKPEYDYVAYYSYNDIYIAYKNYTIGLQEYISQRLAIIEKHPIVSDKETVPHIKSLIKILESEGEKERLKSKLFFLEKQFEDAISKSKIYLEKCTSSVLLAENYRKDSEKPPYYKEFFEKVILSAKTRGIVMHYSRNLDFMNDIYIYLKEVLYLFVKTLGNLLIEKPDPDNNQIFKDDIDEFDISIPKSNLTALETKFIEIFEQEWDSYDNKKALGKNGNQDYVSLILQRMKELKDLIDSMEVYKTNDVASKEQILSEIDKKLSKRDYKEIESGLKESYKLAKDWKKSKLEIKTKLEKDNEKTIKLEKEITDLFDKYSEIYNETIYINTLKLELEEKIKCISEKNEYIKKAIDLKKVIENNNAYIDELAKNSPYQVTEYVNKKNEIYNTIKSELPKIYKGDLDELYNELSSIVKDNAIDNIEDRTKLDDLKSKIYEEYNKIQNMETEAFKLNLSTIEDNKNELLSTIVEMKKHIYNELNNELNKIVENFKSNENQLSSNINDYSNYNDELNKYKSKLLEIKNHYNGQSNIDNIKGEEAKHNYEESKEYTKTISTKEDEISKTINDMKRMKDGILNKVSVFVDLENNHKEKINLEHESFVELVNKIKNEISDNQFNEYEQKFNDNKSLINETSKSIEKEYQNINTLKKVNSYLKICKNTAESIEKFRNKQNKLNEILNKNIETIKNCNLIEKLYTNKFDNTLTDKKTELEKTFTELSLSHYEENNKELIKYFNDLKENLGTPKGNILYHQLAENEKAANDIEQKNINANKNISNIEMVIYTSIYNISDEIEKLIGKNIELLNKEILKEAQTSITNFNEIKEKLKHYNFDDFVKEENIKYADEINKIKDGIKTLDQKADKNIETLTEIKRKSENYINEIKAQIGDLEVATAKIIDNEDPKEIEKKTENIVTKIDKKKNIYDNLKKLLNGIAEIEKDKTSIEEVKNINMSYEKSINKLFLEKIGEEKKKSENMIKSMEKYVKDIDEIKNQSSQTEIDTFNISHSKYKDHYITSQNNEKYISEIHEKSLKLIEGNREESNTNDIKKKLQMYLLDAQKRNDDINLYLSELTNLYNIFKLNNIKKIMDEVEEYTKQIEEYNKNVKSELDKSETLIKTAKEKLDLETWKSKIESTIDDKSADECIKKITESKNYILSKESNSNTYFKNAKEYNENASLLFKNIEIGNNKVKYIVETEKDHDTSGMDYNLDKLKENIDKSKKYKEEADKNAKQTEKNNILFEQYKKDVTELLNKYSELAIKNKVAQTKKDSNIIINEIKELQKQITLQTETSEQKINKIKKEKFSIEDSAANNNKSNKAAIGIQTSLEKFENKLLRITNIKKKINDCLTETKIIEKQISSFSINSQDTELNSLQTSLESLKDQKKNIKDQKIELDNLDSEINSIENDVDQHKKNYEIGILEKIKEAATTNKGEFDLTKNSIETIIKNIISSFNTNDLEGIDTNESLERYNTEMNNIHNEFISSYNLIIKYLETASKEPITYDQIKNTRITAQNELLKIIESKKKSKSYLDNVKIKEFDRIITHFKSKLDNMNDKFKKEYSNINKGLEDISKSIEKVKNSTNENSLFDTLKQTKDAYMGMIGETYYSYKHEAESIFKNMVKLAYSLNIQIQNNSGINLFDNVKIAILYSLNSETKDTLKFIPSSENEPEIYTKIRNSYDTVIDIFKKSQDTHKKEQDTLKIMAKNQHLYEKIHASNELKGALSDTKYKKERILNDAKLVLHKFNELNQLTCDSQNYDTILELSNQNQIKIQIDNYEQEKRKFGMDFNVTIMEEKLDNIIKSIEKFENNHDSSEKKDSNIQSNDQLNKMTELFNTEIKTIEDKIIEKNNLIDKLTKMRKKCLLFTYATLVETLKSKVINYSKFITSVTKFSKEYLEYINNSADSLNDDIDALQTKYNLNQTKKYTVSNITHITNNNNNLIEKEKEATQTINNLTKLFTIDFQNAGASILYYNKIQMTYLYSQLQKSIDFIKQLYKEIRAFKLSNIYLINEKYSDISKQFDNVLQIQKNKLTENLNNLKEIEQFVSDKKQIFLHAVNENTNSNFNSLKEIYDNIISRENKAHDIEHANNKENENIMLYTNTITKLTEKIQNTLNFVTTYENDNNIIKQHIQDNDENDVLKIKEILKSTIQSFQQIQNKINEIKAQFYGNNNINSIIITISQNANDIKTLFSKDLDLSNELIQIQNRLENIKNVAHENKSEQIVQYTNAIHNYVEQQFKQIENNPNENEIDRTMENIRSYNNESKVKLQQISNYKNEVESIITKITNLIALIKSKYGNNNISHKAAIKHEEDAQNMLNDLNNSQNILNRSINQNKKSIEDLGYKKHGIYNHKNLHTINKDQEISQIKYPSNDTRYKNDHYSNSDKKGSFKTKSSGDYIRYAGAISFGLVACYAIVNFKKKDNTNEMNLDNHNGFCNETENMYFERDDEIIEINMNDDLLFN
ncbi:reticulocyte binding protein, putative [Plasmodium vinckei brucechwatti]|uniref:Reticulocyte binding protein, putative n=1 Tax=Plasmodium vinckei brucechwatti TaxID=119398 RepID=A0A6V7RWB7_PLAVN|nr:reticulocyte binding protein, putative [Plasmodium vinckei brucechwatti]